MGTRGYAIMSIDKVDADTYDVQSETDPKKTYMVYNSLNEGWTCECMWWSIHCKHKPPHPQCKHIKKVLETFIKK